MLVLSCIPCSDAEALVMEQTSSIATTAKSASEHSDKSGQEHKDFCSPFCQCSCCALAYALPIAVLPEITMRASVSDKIFATYLQQRPVGIAIPVWQPPKLV
jgi:hypothetical protein